MSTRQFNLIHLMCQLLMIMSCAGLCASPLASSRLHWRISSSQTGRTLMHPINRTSITILALPTTAWENTSALLAILTKLLPQIGPVARLTSDEARRLNSLVCTIRLPVIERQLKSWDMTKKRTIIERV